MSIPKFNLQKLKESVAQQQSATKKDIKNLLLLERLQAEIAKQVESRNQRSIFGRIGRKLTKEDKVDLKKDPEAILYNEYIDSILSNREANFSFDEDDYKEEDELNYGDFFRYLEDKLMENYANAFSVMDSDVERVFYLDYANNKLIYVYMDHGSYYLEMRTLSWKNTAFFSLRDKPIKENTKENILKTIANLIYSDEEIANRQESKSKVEEELEDGILAYFNQYGFLIAKVFVRGDISFCLFHEGYDEQDPLESVIDGIINDYNELDINEVEDLDEKIRTNFNKRFAQKTVYPNEIIEFMSIGYL